ncbi:hypothetical protein GALMADRAFT_245272 [Galerina marginata CBS 339.88]|uniref:acylaminoacyl-peptidase n=1 Tax=Galerina marginata (strain CBS 339.88) TaxID=685588 RepID=A0A067T4U6_GALM3|nr:hypothetical protein GALMADRAFT_245272 [Galerina marginata CBS 339.88]
MYSELAEIPLPSTAQFVTRHDQAGPTVVEVSYTIRDHIRKCKRTVAKSIVFSADSTSIPAVTALHDVDVVAQLISSSGRRRAVLRKASGSRFVEIWTDGLLETSMNVTEYHGEFYADEFIGSLSFSPSETSILYAADDKSPEGDDPFEKFRYNPDFGEGLHGKRSPVIFIFRWDKPSTADPCKITLSRLRTAKEIRFGQAVFSPNSEKIIYAIGYELTVDGRMLGIKGCFNRPSGIWQLVISSELPAENTKNSSAHIDTTEQKLTPAHQSCRSPRILTHKGKSTLIWLACATGGAHLATSSLHSLDISLDASTALDIQSGHNPLVGIVDKPATDGFPGLYPPYSLLVSPSVFPASSWSGASIILHSQWGSRITVLQISLADGTIKNLTPSSDNDLSSWSVLATDGRSLVVCSRSSPSVPYEIMLGKIDKSGPVIWRSLDKPDLPEYVRSALASIKTTIVPIPGRPLVETILIQGRVGTGASVPPCITSPHGGPHGGSTTAFSPTTSALVVEGYTISFPNYTGTPGYGEAFLQGLIGRCGELDVQDCIAAARHLISIGISREGPGMQLITGGSHGGFLTGHLIGQFPTFFSAAILRNPVISAGDISSSDIRDWYFSEFGISYPLLSSTPSSSSNDSLSHSQWPPLVTPQIFATLQAASPIAHVDSVRVPVLLLIGAADRRVAPSQGIDYYHALRARYAQKDGDSKLRVEMLIFEGESHPLDGVEAAKASFEATKRWFAAAQSTIL